MTLPDPGATTVTGHSVRIIRSDRAMNTLDLSIVGMHCDGCAGRIRSLLSKESGVHEISVSSQSGTGRIVYSPQSIDEQRIVTIIEHAGFAVERE